jgi:hypothetical protein
MEVEKIKSAAYQKCHKLIKKFRVGLRDVDSCFNVINFVAAIILFQILLVLCLIGDKAERREEEIWVWFNA